MSGETAWKTALAPFANDYEALIRSIELNVEGLGDEELAVLLDQARQATQSNCWWAAYGAAQLVLSAVNIETYRRSLAADLGGGS